MRTELSIKAREWAQEMCRRHFDVGVRVERRREMAHTEGKYCDEILWQGGGCGRELWAWRESYDWRNGNRGIDQLLECGIMSAETALHLFVEAAWDEILRTCFDRGWHVWMTRSLSAMEVVVDTEADGEKRFDGTCEADVVLHVFKFVTRRESNSVVVAPWGEEAAGEQ